jgi:DUF4097 and DUF4098 domain-containing protein YvlB
METVNGGVELALPNDSKASIEARCVNGGVHVDGVSIKRPDDNQNDFERRRRLTGDMNGGGARVRMSTTNGGVRLSESSGKKTT